MLTSALRHKHLSTPVSESLNTSKTMFDKKRLIRNSMVEIQKADITACLQQI